MMTINNQDLSISKAQYDPSYDIFEEMQECVDFLKSKIQKRQIQDLSNAISWPLPIVVAVESTAGTQVDNLIAWPLPYICL